MQVKKQELEPDMEQQTGSKLGTPGAWATPGPAQNRVPTGIFNFYAEYIMRNAGLEESQAGIKIAGRNINKIGRAHV